MRFFLRALKNAIFFIVKQIVASVITILVLISIVAVLIASMLEGDEPKRIDIPSGTYIYLSLPQGIGEKVEVDWRNIRMDSSMTFYELIKTLEDLRQDNKVEGLILDLDNLNLASAQVEELSKKILELKRTGKKIYAFGNYINRSNYSLGIYADEIYMTPSFSTNFSIGGYSIQVPYYKELGDRFGIEAQVINTGAYKSMGENYIKQEMSQEFRSNYTRILDAMLDNFIYRVSHERKIGYDTLKNKLLAGDYLMLDSKSAKSKELIDGLEFYDDFLKKKDIEKVISINRYFNLSSDRKIHTRDRIALIVASGEIRMAASDSFSSNYITPNNIGRQIDLAMKDDSIKGVVLRVDSPGGSALASEIILDKLIKLNEIKPVYVSMASTAASGGYYISSNASKIFADSRTLTGSIGVVTLVFNLQDFYNRLGLNWESIEKGRTLSLGNSARRLSKEDIEIIRRSNERTYNEFKTRVAQGRGMDINKVEELAKGQLWTGEEAIKLNLVDELGGLESTINALAMDLDLVNYSVIDLGARRSRMDILLELGSMVKDGNLPNLYNKLFDIKERIKYLEEINGQASYILPYNIEI